MSKTPTINVDITEKDVMVCKNCGGNAWGAASCFYKPRTPIIGQTPMASRVVGFYCLICGPAYDLQRFGMRNGDFEESKGDISPSEN